MDSSLTQQVIGVIAKTQHIEAANITPESTFEQLGIDSLDGINIVFALENEFGIAIPDEAAKSLRSIQDAVNGVAALVAEKQPQ